MRYVLPALPVSGPSGTMARRHEAARLAQRQGAARRSGKTRPAVATPQLPEIARVSGSGAHSLQKPSLSRANLINKLKLKLQNYNRSSALITAVLSFWWRKEAHTQQGRAHSRRLHPGPDEAARPALMSRAAHAVESKAVVRIEVAVSPRPCLGCAVELASCASRLSAAASHPGSA
jgi:hypothetical protein